MGRKKKNINLGIGIELTEADRMKFNKAIARRIKLILDIKTDGQALSLNMLERASGVDKSIISRIKNEKTDHISIFNLFKICKTLNIPLSVFFEKIEEEIDDM